uniref:uncharacterized protein C1orf189 homolog n=1 Tax=Styela clava TaxID=7725 RepID=UPI0019392FB8|nr:uncharacterized protein C1orf189 homolog [Styela clava]
MSMNMSLRYEVPNPRGHSVSKQKIEKDRIMKDELMAERIKVVQTELDVGLKAAWAEGLEEASTIKRYDMNKEENASQLYKTKRALVSVRRAALKKLLETKYEQHEREIHKQGMAFYKKRT